MIRRMFILGATGDLALRYLLPAMARLGEAEKLPEGFEISALARDDRGTEAFRAFASERLADHAADVSTEARGALVETLQYYRADVTDPERMRAVLGDSREPIVAYLALPPAVFAPTIKALRAAGMPEGSRIVLEKPFGEDLESAKELNWLLHETFPEEAVFRVDHFLGLQTVQNILGLRFANRVFEPLWNRARPRSPGVSSSLSSKLGEKEGSRSSNIRLARMVRTRPRCSPDRPYSYPVRAPLPEILSRELCAPGPPFLWKFSRSSYEEHRPRIQTRR